MKYRPMDSSPPTPPPSSPDQGLSGELSVRELESLALLQHRILEACALGFPTQEALDSLCLLVEEMVAGSVASLFLYDSQANILQWGAGPHVPRDLREALFPLQVKPGMGSCPASILSKGENFVEDTLTDPRWERVRSIAREYGILACWSLPIEDGEGEVFGTFAISMDREGGPSPFENQLLKTARYLAAVVLMRERQNKEREALAKALNNSRRLDSLWRLAGGVAHEFNNILTTLLAYCDLMKEKAGEDGSLGPGSLSDLEELEKAGLRGVEVAGKLLLFGREDSFHPILLEPNRIVEELCLLLRRVLREDLELNLVLAPQRLRIQVDEAAFGQAVLYLLLNVRDRLPTGGRILIETRMEGPQVEDAQRPDRLGSFHLLVCGKHEDGFSLPEQGWESALSMVRGFARRSGGRLKLGKSQDGASCWELVLPAFAMSDEAPLSPGELASSKVEPLAQGRTILVCEDEPSIRNLLERILEAQGFQVLLARDAEEAEELFQLQGESVDLLVTDLVLPRQNGYQLACRLRDLRKELPVIVITGYSPDLIPPKPEGLSIPVLKKPFRAEALLQLIGKMLLCEPE